VCLCSSYRDTSSIDAGEDHPDVQSRPGCTRLVMVLQPPSAKNGTLQSDVDTRDGIRTVPEPNRTEPNNDGSLIFLNFVFPFPLAHFGCG